MTVASSTLWRSSSRDDDDKEDDDDADGVPSADDDVIDASSPEWLLTWLST